MLFLDLIHGDLSCYNILYKQGRPVIIDFPQMINARYHSEAKIMLERDIRNVLIFCKTPDAQGQAWRMAERLWKNYNGCNFL
jgi:serine/threonine-protein kinase RIO1